MPQLRDDRAAAGMNEIDHALPAGQRLAMQLRRSAGPIAARAERGGMVDPDPAGHDQAHLAVDAPAEVVPQLIAGHAVRRCVAIHRRHHDAVGERQTADDERCEQSQARFDHAVPLFRLCGAILRADEAPLGEGQKGRADTMRIDVHAHYISKEYVALLEAVGAGETDPSQARPAPSLEADLDTRFGAMAAAGVDAQLLSGSTVQPYLVKRDDAVRGARMLNDATAEVVRGQRARFGAFAALPLPHIDASLEELRRAFDELAMDGIGITTSILGKSPADPAFDPVWRELDRRSGVLFIHPTGFACGSEPIRQSRLRMPLGGTLEDTFCAMQLMERGFQTIFPNVRVILAHLAGSLPFLLHRFERSAGSWPLERERPSLAIRRYWYDSVNGHPAALRCACETFGPERIMLGTDYPYWSGDAHVWAIRYVEESGLSQATIDAILGTNAQLLFPGRFSDVLT